LEVKIGGLGARHLGTRTGGKRWAGLFRGEQTGRSGAWVCLVSRGSCGLGANGQSLRQARPKAASKFHRAMLGPPVGDPTEGVGSQQLPSGRVVVEPPSEARGFVLVGGEG